MSEKKNLFLFIAQTKKSRDENQKRKENYDLEGESSLVPRSSFILI